MSVLTSSTTSDERAWRMRSDVGARQQRDGAARLGRWAYFVAGVSWLLYSVAAVWITDGLHLQIGDSLARMANARAMLFSRDPHLAAIGLYWMPLPTVGQLPAMLLLSPLHHPELAGPLTCAAISALTVLVLAQICSVLELPRWPSILLVLSYALSPVIVYTSGNGMSEAWSFFGLALTMLGYIRWSRWHRTTDLAFLASGLAVVMLVRYEALLLAPLLAVMAALNDGQPPPRLSSISAFFADCRQRSRRWVTTAAIISVPTYFTIFLWCLMQYVLVRNPLEWYDQQKSHGHTTKGAYITLPAHTLTGIGGYVLHMTLLLIPAIFVIGPLLFAFRRRYSEILTGVGIVVGMAIWPLIVLGGLIVNESAGAPRYFEPALVAITVGAIWISSLAQQLRRPPLRSILPLVLVVVVVASAIVGAVSLESPLRTNIESENQFFDRILGHRAPPLPATAFNGTSVWRTVAHDLDLQLARGARVIDDQAVDDDAYVFSQYPKQWIVNSDRDYLQTISNPAGKFEYIIVARNVASASEADALQGIIRNPENGNWVEWKAYTVAIVYRLDSAAKRR